MKKKHKLKTFQIKPTLTRHVDPTLQSCQIDDSYVSKFDSFIISLAEKSYGKSYIGWYKIKSITF